MKLIPPSIAAKTASTASDSLIVWKTPPSEDAPNDSSDISIPVLPNLLNFISVPFIDPICDGVIA